MNIPYALRNDLDDTGLGQSQFVETRQIQPTSGSTGGGSQGQIRYLLPKQKSLRIPSFNFGVFEFDFQLFTLEFAFRFTSFDRIYDSVRLPKGILMIYSRRLQKIMNEKSKVQK